MSSGEKLLTGEMIGLFAVFGSDSIVLVVLLAAGGVAPLWVAGLVTAVVLGVFAMWVLVRWWRLTSSEDVDAVETLKQRYAAGELSEAEFEHRLDRALDTPEKAVDSPEGAADHGPENAGGETASAEAERVR